MTRRSTRAVFVAGGMAFAGAIAAIFLVAISSADQQGFLPDSESLIAQQRSVDASSARVLRVFTDSGGIVWTVASYSSSDGRCLVVEGTSSMTGDDAGLTGCGIPDNPIVWGQGGVRLDDQWYRVVYGLAPAQSSSIRSTLRTGAIVAQSVDSTLVWMRAVPSQPADPAAHLSLVEALDAQGTVLASYQPPSLSAYEKAVADAVAAASAAST